MYLSRVFIDTKKHESMKAFYNLEVLHGMIESSFDGPRQRNLWRIDELSGEKTLLLLSENPPQNNRLPEQIGLENFSWETKSYEALLNRIVFESKWHFRLTANPTICSFKGNDIRGKVKAITVSHKQKEWLKEQAKKHGFCVCDGQFDVVNSEWKSFKKGTRDIQVISATFEGVLTVNDAELFKETLLNGIGREKAYGCGLITVMPYV